MSTDTDTLTLWRVAELDVSAIERADLQPSTKAKYTREIQKLHLAGVDPFDRDALAGYAAELKSSRRAFLKSALRLMSADYEQAIKAGATPENLPAAQAAIMRLEAMRDTVTVQQAKGTKAHTWLSQAQVKEITSLCADDLEGKRDWIVLGLLLGAGLRREELATLTFDALKTQGKRDVLEVKGKGAKSRIVPISGLLAGKLREWAQIASCGRIARSVGRSKKLGKSLSAVGIFAIVRKYGAQIGIPDLDPHDLRRTYTQIGYEAGIPITQLSKLLGHASVTTTQRYLNLDLDLDSTASDFIPLSGD